MYEVRLSQRALRQLRSLDSVMKRRVVSNLEELGDDPFPRASLSYRGFASEILKIPKAV